MQSKSDPDVLIVTHENDLHALLVQEALEARHGLRCHVLEFDVLPIRGGLSWSADGSVAPSLRVRGGATIDVRTVGAVWWRRLFGGPFQVPGVASDVAMDLITGDSRAAIEGLLLEEVRGAWVSHPRATRSAENKLVQLRAARRAGLRIPRTLVSQEPAEIRRFCAELHDRVVIKPVRGTARAPLLTVPVTADLLASDASLSVCPAIYQELVEGTRHIRANCFGEEAHAVLIEAAVLDWRADLGIPMSPMTLSDDVRRRLLEVLRILDLRMGIFDLKIDPAGEVVWLEVNPQGQFVFLQPLAGIDLVAPFSDFLRAEAVRGGSPGARSP
jgi:hypothetical protein